jgi:drug/metabolite transporter (DMT)-like permease
MTPYIGEIAGLLTSFFFALNSVFITKAGQQVGAVVSNRTRVFFALLYLAAINLVLYRQPFAFHASSDRWLWLSLSGIVGLALGDAFLFQSYLSIGPRLGNLLLSLSPVIAALEAWVFLDQHLRIGQMAGIALALAGIVWVVLERRTGREPVPSHIISGIVLGVVAAFCQATGLVLSRQGLYGDFSPLQGNAIRMLAAAITLLLIALAQKQAGSTLGSLKAHPGAIRMLGIAGFVGPVMGVSFSLLAVQHAPVGVASILTSLTPVFMLPISALVFKEQLKPQAFLGTFLAMAGVAILFLS